VEVISLELLISTLVGELPVSRLGKLNSIERFPGKKRILVLSGIENPSFIS
jgi:hypothetical protein